MKGYYNGFAYMGFVPSIGKYQQFESEEDYLNYGIERGEIGWISLTKNPLKGNASQKNRYMRSTET